MRQVGILCAAALVGLHNNVAKLETDHKRAKILAGTFCLLNSMYPIWLTTIIFSSQALSMAFLMFPSYKFRGTKSNQRTDCRCRFRGDQHCEYYSLLNWSAVVF